MRLEQLVLYGPGDDDRVRFGPRLTVMGGLGAAQRQALTSTVAEALAGRVSNASLIFTDAQGRRVFADRTGATYADSGGPAPSPRDLLGTDPEAIAGLITLSADDLGLGTRVSASELRNQLAAARGELSQRQAEHRAVEERARQIDEWRTELIGIDRRIMTADDDAARWKWLETRRQLDEARAEIAMLDAGVDGQSDERLLAAVDALRAAGASWADLASEATELNAQLGDLPPVSAEDLDRVAGTPDSLPRDFLTRVEAWRSSADAHRAAVALRAEASGPVPTPDDPLVVAFAGLDQDRLWAVHSKVVRAMEAYTSVSASSITEEVVDESTARAVEDAHIAVVRAQRRVDQHLPTATGVIGLLVVLAVIFAVSGAALFSPLFLAAAAAVGWYLILRPRRSLSQAQTLETEALGHTDAASWLGLHLRRLDAVTDSVERKRFEQAAHARAAAMVDWEEVAGLCSPDDLTSRAEDVRAYANATDPKLVASRREKSRIHVEATEAAERSARTGIGSGLEPYGVSPQTAATIHPDQLVSILERRMEAGRIARQVQHLVLLRRREADAARRLDLLLRKLGIAGEGLEGRLERAINAVAAARQRQALSTGARMRSDIELDVAKLSASVEQDRRPHWDDSPDLASPPTDPNVLEARRKEISELVAAAGRPDVVGAERQFQLATSRVRTVEDQIDDIAGGGSVAERLIGRLDRAAAITGGTEAVPVLIDSAFNGLPEVEQLSLLDLLMACSSEVQIVLLSDDSVVTRWAREKVATGSPLTLLEAQQDEASVPLPAPDPKADEDVDQLTYESMRSALEMDSPLPFSTTAPSPGTPR